MKGFLLGLLVAALLFGGYLVWKARTAANARVQPVAAKADAGSPAKKKRGKRARGAARVAQARGEAVGGGRAPSELPPEIEAEPEPEPIKLSAADLRVVGQGDDLSRPDVIRMDLGNEQELPELSQEDIDERFRAEEGAILSCINDARPDGETYVPGRVTVKFRIQRAGTVRGVRVEAPAILQKGGIFGCIKGVLGRMRFPASNSSQIATYPFALS